METLVLMQQASGAVSAAAGVPLHRQLFLVLHDEIARGALNPGDALPTEQSLCDQFGVSRITVRRALADLAEQGYIERRQGVGSFVRQQDPGAAAPPTGSYLDSLRQTQFQTFTDVVEHDTRIPPSAIGDALGVSAPMLHILRVRRERRTREPLMTTEAWLPTGLAGVLTASALGHNPLYELLAGAGVVVDRMQHEITAEIAGPRNAALLDVPIGSALLRLNRLTFVSGTPHHYVSILLSPSRSRVLMRQSPGGGDAGDGLAIAHDVRRSPR
ncbi:GntR family transcriptional regulator [Mycobacterium paraterrae]|uniref:GntR family transcriptional regulator n=1 Tax=Mycobacterium paraterrae TaxID=577492 RepID=A0ABY3VT68_9MYCO|nr:GntR family transcriptional regulator [Mycobacterium paraterrae]UMB71272.2 GntR family transcriptional regulator [Mycobacterium paraterrae]